MSGLPLELLGDWLGSESLAASPWAAAGSAQGAVTFAVVAGGKAISQSYRQTREGQPSFELHAVLTLDPQTGELLYFAFDSYGFPPLEPARGALGGQTLTLEKHTPRGAARQTLSVVGERLDWQIEHRAPGGEWAEFMTGQYVRQA